MNKSMLCIILMIVVGIIMILNQNDYFAPVKHNHDIENQPIKLWQLKKDIERAPVPVTGKVTGLGPPKLGEHDHAH